MKSFSLIVATPIILASTFISDVRVVLGNEATNSYSYVATSPSSVESTPSAIANSLNRTLSDLSSVSQLPIPPGAIEAGFGSLTWSISSFSKENVDLQRTRDPKYKMFVANYFRNGAYSGEDPKNVAINRDGSITLGKGRDPSWLGSIARVNDQPNSNFVGTAFGGGGYFEAVISFETQDLTRPLQSPTDARMWPAWWSMSAEHIVQRTDLAQWPLQQWGYEHFVEADFFEALVGPKSYITAVHDWYGIWNVTCPGYCHTLTPYSQNLVSPGEIDWRQPHKVAGRWIPATNTSRGSLAFFLDDRKVAESSWSKFDDQLHTPPVMSDTPWRFGVIDQQHLVLLINGGVRWPMTVHSIKVWQRDASKNISRFPDAPFR